MKRVIYKPAVDDAIPDSAITYTLPINGLVIDVIVSNDFITAGVIVYDSVANIALNEKAIHHFAGWEF